MARYYTRVTDARAGIVSEWTSVTRRQADRLFDVAAEQPEAVASWTITMTDTFGDAERVVRRWRQGVEEDC